MQKRAWNVKLLLLAGVLAVALITGCSGSNSLTFPVSGKVTDKNGVAMPGVTILFNGVPGATSDMKGNWTKTGISGNVTVTAMKDGYVFARFKDGKPVSNTPLTRGSQFISFTGYSLTTDKFPAAGHSINGTITNRGLDEPEASFGQGLAGVTLRYTNPISGEEKTVDTNSNGDWVITDDLVGAVEVTVQSAPAGWIVLPDKFILTLENYENISVSCTKKSYSGAEIRAMASTYFADFANGGQVPTTVTVDGDTLRIEDATYLLAKYMAIANTQVTGTNQNSGFPTTVTIEVPATVPYLAIAKPTVAPSGTAQSGSPNVIAYQDYKTLAVELAGALENTPVLPANFNVTYSTSDTTYTPTAATMRIDWIISILGRATWWSTRELSKDLTPNYASIRTTVPPNDWPTP